jgi:hypothetical protein
MTIKSTRIESGVVMALIADKKTSKKLENRLNEFSKLGMTLYYLLEEGRASITDLENTTEYNEVNSDHDKNFLYRVGETVEVKDFDDDRWNECSTGIHFFITRDEAVIY